MRGPRLPKQRVAAAASSSPGFPADHVQAAVAQLDLLGALEQKDGQLTLTPVGRKMAAFPLDPKFAKVSHLLHSLPLLRHGLCDGHLHPRCPGFLLRCCLGAAVALLCV